MSKTESRACRFSQIAALLALAGIANMAFAQTPPALEERLSESEFKAYGLDKLSAEELQGLNRWLQTKGAAPATVAHEDVPSAGNDERLGFRERSKDRREITARLPGRFTGWNGRTIFKLDNGQEWQQAEPGMQGSLNIDDAEITIKPKMMGNWLLVVDYCQCRIGVTRIK